MARIRTIKPEFPQSESMGRVSRDARLLFIQLWTICDDSGRTRAASRLLASLLYPYDEDAPSLIDGWLDELEREGCLVRYGTNGCRYLQISKWLSHQKIDKPSASRFPEFDEASRLPREDSRESRERSSEDQGPRTKDQGRGPGKPRKRGPSPSAPCDTAFDSFWARYPRKIGKPAAVKAWKAAKADPPAVMAGLERWIGQWHDPQFIPHPSTFLNQRRWEDAPSDQSSVPDKFAGAL